MKYNGISKHFCFLLLCTVVSFRTICAQEDLIQEEVSTSSDEPLSATAPEKRESVFDSVEKAFSYDHDFLLATYAEYLAGNGIGYRGGYATLGLEFFPEPLCLTKTCCFSAVQPFLDFRTHILNDGNAALNLGGGARFLCPSFRKVFGINFFYDYRNTWKSYHQLGLGLEMLSGCDDLFDMRLNFYLPVGDRTQSCCPHVFTFPGGFFAIATKRQSVLSGGDFEIDTRLSRFARCCCSDIDLYLGVGGYYYHGKCAGNIVGAKGRVGLEYCDLINFELRVSYDSLFKTNVQGLIGIVYYFGDGPCGTCGNSCCSNQCACDCDLECIALQPVQRQEIIVQDKKRCFFETNF